MLVVQIITGCATPAHDRSSSVARTVRAQGETFPDTMASAASADGHAESSGLPLNGPVGETKAVRYAPLTLRQAVMAALQGSDVVRTLNGSVTVEETTHVDPRIQEALLAAERAAFDPRIDVSASGREIDDPPSSFFGPGIQLETRRDEGEFATRLVKPWSTGGEWSIGYDPSLAYLNFPRVVDPDEFNPAYSSRLSFELRQPLLRGASPDVNTAPIRIARARVDQSIWEVQQVTLAQIRSVERAYWELLSARTSVRAVEEVLPFVRESVRIAEERARAERGIEADALRARVELERLLQRLAAERLAVRRRGYVLRQLVHLPIDDGTTILPIDVPESRRPAMNSAALVTMALVDRPDLRRRRLELDVRDQRIRQARNAILPQVDLRAAYRTSGLGTQWDDALTQMGDFSYDDLSLGVTLSTPLGNRRARAEAQAADLLFAKERRLLLAHEERVGFEVATLVAEVESLWERFASAQRQIEQTREWLRVSRIRYESPRPGRDNLLVLLSDYQRAIEQSVDAVSGAGELLAAYNAKLAELDEAIGGSLETWRIELGTDGLEPDVPRGMQLGLPTGYARSPSWSYHVDPAAGMPPARLVDPADESPQLPPARDAGLDEARHPDHHQNSVRR